MSESRSMSNPQVAELIHVHFTHASRLRSGRRKPSRQMMSEIKRVFGWSIDDQSTAIDQGTFATEFEGHITEYAATHPQEPANV